MFSRNAQGGLQYSFQPATTSQKANPAVTTPAAQQTLSGGTPQQTLTGGTSQKTLPGMTSSEGNGMFASQYFKTTGDKVAGAMDAASFISSLIPTKKAPNYRFEKLNMPIRPATGMDYATKQTASSAISAAGRLAGRATTSDATGNTLGRKAIFDQSVKANTELALQDAQMKRQDETRVDSQMQQQAQYNNQGVNNTMYMNTGRAQQLQDRVSASKQGAGQMAQQNMRNYLIGKDNQAAVMNSQLGGLRAQEAQGKMESEIQSEMAKLNIPMSLANGEPNPEYQRRREAIEGMVAARNNLSGQFLGINQNLGNKVTFKRFAKGGALSYSERVGLEGVKADYKNKASIDKQMQKLSQEFAKLAARASEKILENSTRRIVSAAQGVLPRFTLNLASRR